MSEILNITQLGVAGLAVFLFYKLLANHLDHNTKAIIALTELIAEFKTTVEKCEK